MIFWLRGRGWPPCGPPAYPARARLCIRAMPSMAWWTPSPLRRQSRRIFQVFMWAKTCSTRARTCLWDLLCSFFPVLEFGLAALAAVRDDESGARVAAVGDGKGVADGGLGAGLLPCLAVVAVPGERPADHDDQAGVGIDDDLVVRGVPVVLRPLGDGVVPGGDQGAVHDEHGVLGEPLAGLESEHRPEVVDDAVRRRLRDAEQRRELPHGQVRAPVGRDQQGPVLQGKTPRPALANGIRTLAPQNGHQYPELPWAEPGERGYPGRLRRRDHISHNKIIPGRLGCLLRADGLETDDGAGRGPATRGGVPRAQPA